MTEITGRVFNLMTSLGLNAHQLEVATELPNGSVRGWVKGKKRKDGEYTPTNPSSESVAKLAKYFNVSADYLLCLTDDPKPLIEADLTERPTFALSTELSELSKEKRFVDTAKVYKELPDEYRERAFGLIVGIAVGLGLNVDKILKR